MKTINRNYLPILTLFGIFLIVSCKKNRDTGTKPQPTVDSLYTSVQAYQADQIADMVGINCHFAYPGVYTDQFATLKSRLVELGLRHIRDENNGDNPTFNDHVNQIAGLGMKFDLVCEKWWTPLWTQNRNNLIATKNMSNAPVEFIEYPNEDDASPTWVQDYTTFFAAFRGGDNTSGIPIFGPSFANTPSGAQNYIYAGGGDMSDKMDC